MRKRAQLEGKLNRVVPSQFAGPHRRFKDAHGWIERRRAPRLEVSGVNARSFTWHKKHKLVEIREPQGGVQKYVYYLLQPVFDAAFELKCFYLGREFIEPLVRNRIQEAGAIGVMPIDGYGSDADPFRNRAHRHCGHAFFVMKRLCRSEDGGGGV